MQKQKESVYDEITRRIVAELEKGVAPWVKPWSDKGCGADVSIPRNAITGRAYSGVNVLLLWMFGPPGNRGYATYLQGEKIGAQVRRGEEGYRVVYASSHVKSEVDVNGDEHITSAYSFLKRYTVFHLSQFDNMPERYTSGLSEPIPPLPDAAFRKFVDETGARIVTGGPNCGYHRDMDAITMPPWNVFETVEDYKATLLHELVHWTGAKGRLDRPKGGPHYPREEIIAEIGAAFLCANLGIVGKLQHAEYIGHWVKMLKADSREVFRVAAAAQRACDYLLQLAGANQLQAAE